jgi:membrane protein
MTTADEEAGSPSRPSRLIGWIVNLPFVRRPRAVLDAYGNAGGSLLAEGLAYSALFAGLTGLLFFVGILGYAIPSETDRQRLLERLTGDLAPFVPYAREALRSVAEHAGEFSIVGLAGLAWGASHFYGALDTAIARVFARAPARGMFDRVLRGFVSVLLLVGGLLSGIAIAAIQAAITSRTNVWLATDASQALSDVAFPLATAAIVSTAVATLYRVVPNTRVPLAVLWLPALVTGIVLTVLTELLVFLAPLLAGALSVFGGVAAVFATLAWLHLAFQVLLLGAAWTRVRLDEATGTR